MYVSYNFKNSETLRPYKTRFLIHIRLIFSIL